MTLLSLAADPIYSSPHTLPVVMRSSTALMSALLLLLVVSLAAADINRERTEEETRLIFAEWKTKVGRTYSSIDDEERHYTTFRDNLRKIDQHNATGRISLRSQLNFFSDLTHEKYSAIPCVLIRADHDEHKGACIAYMLFGSGFIIYLWVLMQRRNP